MLRTDGCSSDDWDAVCKFDDDITEQGFLYVPEPEKAYFGRGPIHLRWHSRYAQFSAAYYDD